MSRGFSGGKQWIKFANKSCRDRIILSNLDDDLIAIQNVQLEFRQVLRHYCTCWTDIYGRYCFQNTSTNNLLLASSW